MKKLIILSAFLMLTATNVNAQLKVGENGKVAIGMGQNVTPNSQLSVGTTGDSNYQAYFSGAANNGIYVYNPNAGSVGLTINNAIYNTTTPKGIFVTTSGWPVNGNYVGIHSVSGRTTNNNISIAGCLDQSLFSDNTRGIGVYGSIINGMNFSPGIYAGYFNGNVYIAGSLTTMNAVVHAVGGGTEGKGSQAEATTVRSDENTLDRLAALNAVRFGMDMSSFLRTEKDNVRSDVKDAVLSAVDRQAMERKHYGIDAAQLEKVFPELVYTDEEGNYSINYIEMIPLLLQSINELRAEVSALQGKGARKQKGGETTGVEEAEGNGDTATMEQNVPNPFSGKTDIAIYLPETVKTARLHIYDLNGHETERHDIAGRGETVMTIRADRMEAGMYIYTLIADGQVVTSKKMIVVK